MAEYSTLGLSYTPLSAGLREFDYSEDDFMKLIIAGIDAIVRGVTAGLTAESTAEATAAAPTYTEGQDAPLSQNLSGQLRVIQTGTQRTPTITRVTGSGASPVAAGAKSVTFLFSTDFTGTILGVAYTGATQSITISAPPNDTLASIAYTVTAGSMDILKLV